MRPRSRRLVASCNRGSPCRAHAAGEQEKPVARCDRFLLPRPWAWGADADQGVTLTGSTADGIVVTRAVSGSLRDTEHAYLQ
jgi:hypothetical protein